MKCVHHYLNKTVKTNNNEKFKHVQNNKWFSDECKSAKTEFYKLLNILRNDRSDENRILTTSARSVYKCLVRKNKYQYDSEQTQILEQNRYSDAKRYWNMLILLSLLNQAHCIQLTL